jgi:hypothetical protein
MRGYAFGALPFAALQLTNEKEVRQSFAFGAADRGSGSGGPESQSCRGGISGFSPVLGSSGDDT